MIFVKDIRQTPETNQPTTTFTGSITNMVQHFDRFHRRATLLLWKDHHFCGSGSLLQTWPFHCNQASIYGSASCSQVFYEDIYRLNSMPSSIVCDQDPTFTSHFWRELFHLNGIKFKFTSAQIDGKTEVVKHTVEMNLRWLNGYHGLSFVTIQVSIPPQSEHHLKLFMALLHHIFCHMSLAQLKMQR
jgi:hypothetical protein